MMLYAVIIGLQEKEQNTEQYPYSNKLAFGINTFAAMAYKAGKTDILKKLHETYFIREYASKPIKEWFNDWDENLIQEIKTHKLYSAGPMITVGDKNNFYITEEWSEICFTVENDLFNGLAQHRAYIKMTKLNQKEYVAIRKFLIEHPVSTERELRRIKMALNNNETVNEILKDAYESIPEGCYICPECGWTISFSGKQASCCNPSCKGIHRNKEELTPTNNSDLRLVRGIMRYICLPGKLELTIKEKSEKMGYVTELWPNIDQYDILLKSPSGITWAIDAKTHKDPNSLENSLRTDNTFLTVNADNKFYVIPHELLLDHPDYCEICNNALKRKNTKCITDKMLYKKLKGVL